MEGINFELYLEIAIQLARKAGDLANDGTEKMASNSMNVTSKSTAIDLVTEYDKKVEEFIFNGLKERFPEHKFIGEESLSKDNVVVLTDDPTWVVDPIDGTMNFVHRFPYSAICIGFMLKKEVMIGVVFHMARSEMYSAIKGKGAFLNDVKIQVSNQQDLSLALVGSELGSHRDVAIIKTFLENFEKIQAATHGLRLMGSAALNMCQVARGSLDAYYEFGIHIWDIAAASVIVKEAGGIVVDPSGEPLDLLSRRVLCASSQTVATKLSKLVEPIFFERDGK